MAKGFMVKHKEPITNVYLYKDGDEKTAVTGGWSKAFSAGASSTYTENPTNITMTAVGASGTPADMSVATENMIDLTPYSKLKMEFDGTITNSYSLIGLSVLSAKNTYFQNISVAKTEVKTVKTYSSEVIEVDVTSLNASYYIGAEVYKSSTTGSTQTLVLKKVWLEV